MKNDRHIILDAICDELGVTDEQIRSRRRTQKLVFARMIYAHHRYAQVGDVYMVASELERVRNAVDYYLAKYSDDYKFSMVFRCYAEAVERRLNGDDV